MLDIRYSSPSLTSYTSVLVVGSRRRRRLISPMRVEAQPNSASRGRAGGSDIGFDREGIAVRVLEPGDAATPGPRGDPLGVVVDLVVAGEFDARRDEFVDDLVDVVDVPRRQCRPALTCGDRLINVQRGLAGRTIDAAAVRNAGAGARSQHR